MTKKNPFRNSIILFLLLLSLGNLGFGQVQITAHNTSVNTNFNGWNGTMPNGFVRNTNNNYIGTSESTSGGVYAIPGKGFGYQPSSNSTASSTFVTGTFRNNTGTAISELKISYDAFKIVHRDSRIPCWTVTVSVGNYSTNLNWCSSQANATKTFTSPVNIAANQTFTITLNSDRGSGSGSSPLIGFNNISVESIMTGCIPPAAPTADTQSFCEAGTVGELTAEGVDLKWYNSMTSTNPLVPGTALQTGVYYVTQTVNECESEKTAVQIFVHSAPPAPIVENQVFCGATQVANLVASGSNIKWYNSLEATTPLADNAEILTGTYFVSQTLNDCESERIPVAIQVKEIPAAPVAEAQTFCGVAAIADLFPQSTSTTQTIFQDSFDHLNNWTAVNVLGANVWSISTYGNPVNSAYINGFQQNNEDWLVLNPISISPTVSTVNFSFDSASNYSGPNLEVFYTTNYTGNVTTTNWISLSPTLSTTGYFVWLNSGPVDVSGAIGKDLVIAFKYTSTISSAKAWEIDNFKIETFESAEIKWYASLESTDALSPETPLESGTYYVSQTINGCESERTAIEITANEIPEAPVAESQAFCGEATVGDLVPAPNEITVLTEDFNVADHSTYWSPNSEGLVELASGSWTFNGTGIYSGKLNVRNFAISPEFEGLHSINFTAESPATNSFSVYKVVNGVETLLATEDINGTEGVRHFSMNVDGAEEGTRLKFVTANSNAYVVYDAITFNLGEGDVVSWYDVAEGGEALTSETPLSSGIYFVSQTVNGCESERTAVEVTLNEIPEAPVAEAQAFCGEATVADLVPTATTSIAPVTENFEGLIPEGSSSRLLEAEETWESGVWNFEGTLRVHNTNGVEGSDVLVFYPHTNPVVISPVLNGGVNKISFYAYSYGNSYDLNVMKIVDGIETLVETISLPNSGGVSPENHAYYEVAIEDSSENIRIKLSTNSLVHHIYMDNIVINLGEDETISWYDVAEGGEILPTETVLFTGTYYVSQTVNGCESERTAVEVTVNEIPAAPIADTQIFCGEAIVADLTAEGTDLKWFESLESTEALSLETPLVTGTYYVSQTTVDGCESERTAVEVVINEIPVAPIAISPQEYEPGDTLADLEVEGENLTFYDEAGNVLDPSTPLVDGEVYFVTQTVNGCESEATAIETEELGLGNFEFSNFNFYPNPVKNVLHITNDEIIRKVIVFTLTGELVLTKDVNSKYAELNLAHLSTAIYVVKAMTDKGIKTLKIIKK